MIILQEEEESFDNQNIYGVGQARAQGQKLGYQGADQQCKGHGDGCGRAG